jgi:exosortase
MNSDRVNLKNIWKPVLLGLVLAFLYAGVLSKLGRDWWTDENYSHGLLVPFVIAFIVWLEFEDFRKIAIRPNLWLGGGAILLALLLLLGGSLGAELFTQRVSLLGVPLVLLLLSIPIPQILFNKIAFPLQIYASQIAVWGIRLFEIPTVRKGNVFEILPRGATQVIALEVVEACSGIRSLMTLMTLALILAYFTRAKREIDERGWFDLVRNFDFWRALILMFSAIPIAVLTNAARVTTTGVLTYYYGRQATEGRLHDALGWLVYVVALGLLILLNFALQFVFRKFSPVK